MASILEGLLAGGAAGGAQAVQKLQEEQRKADLDKQLMAQRAEIEAQYQQATEQRHMKQAAQLRSSMAEQVNPATEAILNAQGKTSNPVAPAAAALPAAPASANGLVATDQTPGAPAPTDYSTVANGLLAGPDNVPKTPVAQSKPLTPATPTEQLTARALAMVQNGWVSNPDDILKAAVTLNDTTQTAQARLEAAKLIGEANIVASTQKGAAAAQIRADNPTDQSKHEIVALGRQRDSARIAMQHEQNLAANSFNKDEKATHLRNAEQYKADMDRFNKQISDSLSGGQNTGSVVQSPSANTVSWNSLPK
jgi:hypothetical protein